MEQNKNSSNMNDLTKDWGLNLGELLCPSPPEGEPCNDINQIKNFFATNSPPNEENCDILCTCSRCEGFTLAYGCFYRLDTIIKNRKKIDAYYDKLEKLRAKLFKKFLGVQFYLLPCCWPDETGLDLFVGFSVYPLLWTQRRYFIDGKKLISAQDDCFMRKEAKDNLLKKLSVHRQYMLPDFMENTTQHIKYQYQTFQTWSECLYVNNYKFLKKWPAMLTELYADKIKLFNENIEQIEKFIGYSGSNRIEYQWCFLPTDCAACS